MGQLVEVLQLKLSENVLKAKREMEVLCIGLVLELQMSCLILLFAL
jgi:hypothetical protein